MPAGEILPNIASLTYTVDGQPRTTSSNLAAVRVNEVLDLELHPAAATLSLTRDALTATPFTIVNRGNGREAFLLAGRLEGVSGAIEAFAIDLDGNDAFDPAIDQRLEPGAATPYLAPGASLRFLALVRATGDADTGALVVNARAVTGSGTPGTDFDGLGDGGCDAVVGATTASAEARMALTLGPGSDPTARIELIKSQSVRARNGGDAPVHGAIVTYTIESRFGGSGAVRDARLADPIPAGTAFVPGSLTLDGAALTDAGDGDAGRFDGAAIHVALGDIAGPAVRVIQFEVKIQ